MRLLVAGALLLAACGGSSGADTLLSQTTVAVPDLTTTSSSTSTSTTSPPVASCPPSPFVPTVLPERVAERPPTQDVPYDLYTIIPGTSTSVWSQADGAPVLAVVRGSLPPVRWEDTPAVITVRGVDAALAPLPDGAWGVAWFEGPDRCDEYTIVLYPPATAEELTAIAGSLVEGAREP